MNKEEMENKIKELEWKYWHESNQRDDYASILSLQLSALRVMLEGINHING